MVINPYLPKDIHAYLRAARSSIVAAKGCSEDDTGAYTSHVKLTHVAVLVARLLYRLLLLMTEFEAFAYLFRETVCLTDS